MKKNILLLWFLMSASIFAQNQKQSLIDSLQAALSKTNVDTVQVKLLNEIAWQYILQEQYKPATIHIKKGLDIAKKKHKKTGTAYSYVLLGYIDGYTGENAKALKNFYEALKIAEEINDVRQLGAAHNNIASNFIIQNKFSEALNHSFSALKAFEKIDYKFGIAAVNDNIGWIYKSTGDYEKALKYLFISEKISKTIEDKSSLANCYNSISGVYFDMKDYDKALNYYQKTLAIYDSLDVKINVGIALSNIGIVYAEKEDLPMALEYYNRALKLGKEINNEWLISSTENYLGNLKIKLNQLDEAEQLLKSSMKRSPEFTMDNHASLSDLYRKKGDYKNALEHYELFKTYKDSVYNEENVRKFTEAEMNYSFEKQQDSIRLVNEKEIAIRDATLAANQRQKWFYFVGLLSLATIGGLLYNQSRLRKKKNKELNVLNSELDAANRVKTRFFSILNHDLRSPVSNLIQFLHLKKESPELMDEDTKNRLEQKSIEGAENLLVTMEDLLLWSKGQMENFKPQPKNVLINQLFEDTKKVFSGYQNIHFEYHNPENLEVFTDENYLKTIIRNLTSNAINAFTTTKNPHIIWNAFQENNKTILSITDNGPGADNEKFKALYDDNEVVGIKSGLGLHLIRDLAKAIDCEIEVNSVKSKGTTITLSL